MNSAGSLEDKTEALVDHMRSGFRIEAYVVRVPIEKSRGHGGLTGVDPLDFLALGRDRPSNPGQVVQR